MLRSVVFLPSLDRFGAATKCFPVLFCHQNTTETSCPGRFLPDRCLQGLIRANTRKILYLTDIIIIIVFFCALLSEDKVIVVAVTQHYGVALLFF